MDTELYNLLINKGIINIGTEVTIPRPGWGLDQGTQVVSLDDAEVIDIQPREQTFRIRCASTRDGRRFVVGGSHILQVDGMEPERLAQAFRVQGKKRGRKSRAA